MSSFAGRANAKSACSAIESDIDGNPAAANRASSASAWIGTNVLLM